MRMECTQKDVIRYFLYHLVSIISQVDAVMDYAFTLSSTFSTHQNKHNASDWFIDWDQGKLSELRQRKAGAFRSVRQGNQIICSSVGPASPVGFSHHLFSCRGDQCQTGSSILKTIFPVAVMLGSSVERFFSLCCSAKVSTQHSSVNG